MIKFIKIRDPDNRHDHTDVEVSTDHECLPEIFQEFKGFLQACGFTIAGDIEVVEEEVVEYAEEENDED